MLRYGQGEDYPYHMPGHKRRLFGDLPPSLFQMDITEIDGFDNLHAPEGLIADLQERIAAFYGAKKSYCLVGSSTAGILSAVSAAIPMDGHILMARNCHKSAYHAAYLRRLRISYLYPRVMEGYGIADGITPQQVEEALRQKKDIDAVLIVSPTYEGRISPIHEIAEVVHKYGKILIVDEAHGAHLVLSQDGDYEMYSRKCGNQANSGESYRDDERCNFCPDLVIQSLHKTLPALTQTAVLHIYGDRVDENLLERYLHIYQSSSPSYVLMAGVDNCFTILEKQGKELYRSFSKRFLELVEELKTCKHIRVLATFCEEGETFLPEKQDVGKLLLYPESGLMTGQQLYDLLREEYHLQLEMAAEQFCLAMFTIGDTEEGFVRMRDAVKQIDRQLEEEADGCDAGHAIEKVIEGGVPNSLDSAGENARKGARIVCLDWEGTVEDSSVNAEESTTEGIRENEAGLPLYKAWDMHSQEVALVDCVGRISAEFINMYPPGTPILVPGERFTKEICEYLSKCHEQGLRIQGLRGETLKARCIVAGEGGMQG